MAPKQLRLFKINHPEKGPIYYQDKRRAKHERNKLADKGYDLRIMRGPDHCKGETF